MYVSSGERAFNQAFTSRASAKICVCTRHSKRTQNLGLILERGLRGDLWKNRTPDGFTITIVFLRPNAQ